MFGLILAGRDTQALTADLLQFISFQEIERDAMVAGVMLTIIPEFLVAV